MKPQVIKYLIENNIVNKHSMLKATVKSYGIGGTPVEVPKDILFEDYACTSKGALYVKGCDPWSLNEYLVGASKIHEVNGMDQSTIERLYPEMQP